MYDCSVQHALFAYNFTGKERDTESGLDNFKARFMASSLGRFMSPDRPLVDQEAEDPQSWNLYTYVRNNPLLNTDDDGMGCVRDADGNYSGDSCDQDTNTGNQPQQVVVRGNSPLQGLNDAFMLIPNGAAIVLRDVFKALPPPPKIPWLDNPLNQLAVEMVMGVPEAELPDLLAPSGRKMSQIIARLGIGRGDPGKAMQALQEIRDAAAAAGQVAKGSSYIQDGSTIYRVGNDYLTVAKDGTVLSFVKGATPDVGVAAKYTEFGGK